MAKNILCYKEEENEIRGKDTVFDILQKINEKMEKYQLKIVNLQKKNAEYQLKYKIHECDVSFNELLERSDVYPKIRGMFEKGDYTEGVELLKNANYQKSNKVSYEEMLNWLAISNRMKDMKLDDLQKKSCAHKKTQEEDSLNFSGWNNEIENNNNNNENNEENYENNCENIRKKHFHTAPDEKVHRQLKGKEKKCEINKENMKNYQNLRGIEEKNTKRFIISNQLTSLLTENQNLKKEIEVLKENQEAKKPFENFSKIVHQQIDNMKWGYIEQIQQFEKKVEELSSEKEEFLLIIQELDRLANKQKEIIAKNDEKFANLKKYSL